MASEPISGVSIENMIIAVGSYLHNSDSTVCDIETGFLEDLRLLVDAELERRQALVHLNKLRKDIERKESLAL